MEDKPITSNPDKFDFDMSVNGTRLETIERFKYLESIMSDDDFKSEILSTISWIVVALAKL